MRTLTTGLVIALLALPAVAQRSGEQVLQAVQRQYQRVVGFSVVAVGTGEKSAAPVRTEAHVVKPGSFAFLSDDGSRLLPIAGCDGESVQAASPALGAYLRSEGGRTIAEFARASEEPAAAAVLMIPGAAALLALAEDDPAAGLARVFGELRYEGVETSGREVRHVFVGAGQGAEPREARLAFEAQGAPWLMSLTDAAGARIDFAEWRVRTRLLPAHRLEIVEGWTETSDLAGAVAAGAAALADAAGSAPGAGDRPAPAAASGPLRPAPDFEVPMLGGSTFSLASQRGRVVVLDFWATWCPPCVKGLPTVTRVIDGYSPRDVVFLAVDQGEDAKTVGDYMRARGWEFDVGLDTDRAVGSRFGVRGIPHSVVIDRRGNIRHVHVGFGNAQEYEARMRAELDALVAERE